jgi:cellulose synthase/poly-beta-1,6-N-acetylglucosamine synthase-like glycosyltransferase
MGSGMAFPWRCIQQARLATSNIAEDMQLGLELALAGSPVLFCPDALVTSEFPASREGSNTQRRRWEHGHLSVIMREAPGLLWNGVMSGRIGQIALALDLAVPPLALLLLLLLASWVASTIWLVFAGRQTPFWLTTLGLLLLLLSVLLSWGRYGRHVLSLRAVALVPFYALRKLPLYAKYMFARQQQWVRTKRD